MQELIADFVRDQRRRGLLESTITRRRTDLTAFAREHGDLGRVTTEDVHTFLDARRGRDGGPLTARSRHLWLSNLHAFYGWAVRTGRLERDPTADIDRPKLRRTLPRPIGDDDLAVAVMMAEPLMRCWVLLGALAGLRCAEIAGLERDDVLEGQGLLRIVGKGQRERMVPLHPDVLDALRVCGMPTRGAVFRRRSGGPWPAYAVSQAISRYLRDLGIDATAHQLRHWFGTNAYRVSRDIRVVQELLGHSSPVTTAGYTAFAQEAGSAVVEALRLPGLEVESPP